MSDTFAIYIGVDHLVEIFGLYDEETDAFQNAATMTAQIFESDRATNVGSAITMGYVAASDGNYKGSFDDTVTGLLAEGTVYYVKIVIDSGGIDDVRWLRRTAKYRGSK